MFLVDVAKGGDLEVVMALLDNGYNVSEVRYGKTSLHWAAQFAGCTDYPPEMLPSLLAIPSIDANIKDEDSHQALYYAAENGWIKAVEALIPKTNKEGLLAAREVAAV